MNRIGDRIREFREGLSHVRGNESTQAAYRALTNRFYSTQVGMTRTRIDVIRQETYSSHSSGNESNHGFLSVPLFLFIPRTWE